MFTTNELQTLCDALDMAIQSNKRAQNSKHNPAFQVVYEKIASELQQLKAKLMAERDKPRK